MNIQITFALLLVASVISLQEHGYNETARKHYGLSFHAKCIDYVKTFTCMTTCKSIGFRVYRLDFRCKCSCHELKTTTILPFFKWRTNGTTKTLPSTQSPRLYHIAGTLSPATSETTTTAATNRNVNCEPPKDNVVRNTTAVDDVPNANNSEVTTPKSGILPNNDGENPTKGNDTVPKETETEKSKEGGGGGDDVKEKAKDDAKENPKDDAKENPKDDAKENPKDNAKENPKDDAKENPKDDAKENPKDDAKENPKDDAKGDAK